MHAEHLVGVTLDPLAKYHKDGSYVVNYIFTLSYPLTTHNFFLVLLRNPRLRGRIDAVEAFVDWGR